MKNTQAQRELNEISKEVSINISVFRSSVSKLKSSVADIEVKRSTSSFSKTNIEPFTKDVENIIDTLELLKRYKRMLEVDFSTLRQTGEQMRETDEELASANHLHIRPQPIR
ncbi:TIGR04197 family type VII secretion effector [Salipaludibacillus sp. HK11]|uniref:TIGR04197 family type VII secretion effector n=1 Tax=Salipaludibacillus sp. HK11 TaxID=3394320 RepID=UPI0039FBC775